MGKKNSGFVHEGFVKTCDEFVIELEEQRRLQQQLRQQQQQVEEAQPRPVSLYDLIQGMR